MSESSIIYVDEGSVLLENIVLKCDCEDFHHLSSRVGG